MSLTPGAISTGSPTGPNSVTLTVTSADGLVRTVYTVHVESDAALAALSSTGKGVGPAAAIAALLAMLGIGVGVASRRREM